MIRYPSAFPEWLGRDKWRKSSQWWVLNRKHAAMAVNDREVAREFRNKCLSRDPKTGVPLVKLKKAECYSDEHYFPTLLAHLGRAVQVDIGLTPR